MSKTGCILRGLVMLGLFLAVIALSFAYADSAPGELDKFTYLPFVSKYVRPTTTPESTLPAPTSTKPPPATNTLAPTVTKPPPATNTFVPPETATPTLVPTITVAPTYKE